MRTYYGRARPPPLSRVRPPGLAGSSRAPRVRVPGAPGRPPPGGTVNNVAYVDYLQEARLDLLRRHDTSVSAQPGRGAGRGQHRRSSTSPRSPWPHRPLSVAVVGHRGPGRLVHAGLRALHRAGGRRPPVVHARATTTLTPYDFEAERPRRLTPEERERLLPRPEPVARSPTGPAPAPGAVERRRLARGRAGPLLRRRPPRPRQQRAVPRLRAGGDGRPADRLSSARPRVNGHVDIVIARTEIDYLGQMNLRAEPYDVWARVADVGTTSVAFEAEIRDGDRVMARCRIGRGVARRGRPAAPADPRAPRALRATAARRRSGTDDARRATRSRRSPRCWATRTAVAFMSRAAAVEATSSPTTSMQATTWRSRSGRWDSSQATQPSESGPLPASGAAVSR